MIQKPAVFCLIITCLAVVSVSSASDLDEFKVKRQTIYEFTEKPVVTGSGDRIVIRFASKGYCDVTVAIEDAGGRIVRHLVSGVLGPNAPAPLEKDSLQQELIWDGKNDQGRLIDNRDGMTVRVSLGLRPRLEKVLYWTPYKRISQAAPSLAACEEGVIVHDGAGVDTIKLFDHDGNYLRTIYPFAGEKVQHVTGLDWHDFPQGVRWPLKKSLYQQTLLTSGDNCNPNDQQGRHGRAATAIAARGKTLALAFLRLNRLAADGTTGGAQLTGGRTSFTLSGFRVRDKGNQVMEASPTSSAISPDSKWLYLAGYAYRHPYNFDTMHGVMRIALDGDGDAEQFLGRLAVENGSASGFGSGPGQFNNASSVACDSQGRIYVSDFMNDRVQIFSADGKHLKDIKAFKPAIVRVCPKTGEIWVISWMIPSRNWQACNPAVVVVPTLTIIRSFDDPRQLRQQEIPLGNVRVRSDGKYGTYTGLGHALWFSAEVDFSAPAGATLWVGRECRNDAESGVHPGDGGQMTPYESAGIKVIREVDGKLEIIRDFGAETVKHVVRARPPLNAIQRLEVNPTTGRLYVGEADSGPTGKAHNQLLEITPETGRIRIVDLPFNPMEYVFDLNGYVYLRNTDMIVRYDPNTWREIPFDYGEERDRHGNDGGIMGRQTRVTSGLAMPSKSPVCYHQGGINVSPKGHLIASCAYRYEGISGKHYAFDKQALAAAGGKPYTPQIFPGRASSSTTPCIHVWDQHGRMIYEDALPGVGMVDGVALDRDDNIYVMHTPTRMLDGEKYFDEMSSTLVKTPPGKGHVLTDSRNAPVPLSKEARPGRTPDMYTGGGTGWWVQGAQWFYGGVGFAGFNSARAGGGCACWFSRFALDYFARSIAPEPHLFRVAVLDSAGNLITRIGRFGNADDGAPLEEPTATGPTPAPTKANRKSIGGDEVALFHACYVGTHTDRRIFISDVGNGRILSVKVDYHATERNPIK